MVVLVFNFNMKCEAKSTSLEQTFTRHGNKTIIFRCLSFMAMILDTCWEWVLIGVIGYTCAFPAMKSQKFNFKADCFQL